MTTIHTPTPRIQAYLVRGIVTLPGGPLARALPLPVEYGVASDSPEQARGAFVDRCLDSARLGAQIARKQNPRVAGRLPTSKDILVHQTHRMLEWEREAASLVDLWLAEASVR